MRIIIDSLTVIVLTIYPVSLDAVSDLSIEDGNGASFGYVVLDESSELDSNRFIKKCTFFHRSDNPHISSTSSTIAVQSHCWWDNVDCSASTATVTIGLLRSERNLNPDDFHDVGRRGKSRVVAGGGKGNRATTHFDCNPGDVAWYKAWVDVDVDGVIDSSDITWSNTVKVSCHR